MSADLETLERHYLADPGNIALAQALMNARIRAGWRFHERTAEEWELELQSQSKDRVIDAFRQLSQLGVLAVKFWPAIVHGLDSKEQDPCFEDYWQAYEDTEWTNPEQRLGTFLATISGGMKDRMNTLWRWVEEGKRKESLRPSWSQSKSSAAIFALGKLAAHHPALIPTLCDDFIEMTPRPNGFHIAYRRVIHQILTLNGTVPIDDSAIQSLIKRRLNSAWRCGERTLEEWLIELKSGRWERISPALGAIQLLGVFAHDLWPEIIESLNTPFGEEESIREFEGDNFLHEYFGEFLAMIAANDFERLHTLKDWLVNYDHYDSSKKTLGIIAIRALSKLARKDRSLIPMLVRSFQNTSLTEGYHALFFHHVFLMELPLLLPEAQGARDKIFDAALSANNPTTLIHGLGHFYLEPSQFETILNDFVLNDSYCDRHEASIVALSLQVKRHPERLDWIVKTLESRSAKSLGSPKEYSPLSGDLETLSQIHDTKPEKVLHLLTRVFERAIEQEAKKHSLAIQSLRTDYQYFGEQSDYQALALDERKPKELRKQAILGVIALAKNSEQRWAVCRQVPDELRGSCFEKARQFLKGRVRNRKTTKQRPALSSLGWWGNSDRASMNLKEGKRDMYTLERVLGISRFIVGRGPQFS